MGNYASSLGNEEKSYKVKFGNQFLVLNKKTTSENLQTFDKNLENVKAEIETYFTEKMKKEQPSEIKDITSSIIQNESIVDTTVKVVNRASHQKYLDMFDIENDKFIINFITEMKSFENTRNNIAKTIEANI